MSYKGIKRRLYDSNESLQIILKGVNPINFSMFFLALIQYFSTFASEKLKQVFSVGLLAQLVRATDS